MTDGRDGEPYGRGGLPRGPLLELAFAELLERRSARQTVDQRRDRLFSEPLTQLPTWVATAARERGSTISAQALADIGAAGRAGHLHISAHDDYFDEDVGGAHEVMMLGETLFASAVALMGRHLAASSPFWDLLEVTMNRYGEALLRGRELRTEPSGYDEATFATVLGQSAPLVLPAAAVLAITDYWQGLESLQVFVTKVVRANQLANDLRDVHQDLKAGRPTWVLHRLKASNDAELQRALLSGGFDEILELAADDLASAAAAASDLGAEDAATWAIAMRTEVLGVAETFFARLFGQQPTEVRR